MSERPTTKQGWLDHAELVRTRHRFMMATMTEDKWRELAHVLMADINFLLEYVFDEPVFCSPQEEWVGYPMLICGYHQQPWPCEDQL